MGPKNGMAGSPFLRGFAILDMIYIYTYLEPVCPLFLAFPPKQGLFQSKQGSFEFQVFRYIHVPSLLNMVLNITPGWLKMKMFIHLFYHVILGERAIYPSKRRAKEPETPHSKSLGSFFFVMFKGGRKPFVWVGLVWGCNNDYT